MAVDLARLVEGAKAALRAGEPRKALACLVQIERARPGDPIWPRRIADIHHRLGDDDRELAALVRTSQLQVDAGEIVQAIAACKRILEIDRDHTATLDRLHLLYMVPQSEAAAAPVASARAVAPPAGPGVVHLTEVVERSGSCEVPLGELELTEALPGSKLFDLPESGVSGIAEIPLDVTGELPHDLDLNLSVLDPDDPFREVARSRSASSWSSGGGFAGDSTQNYQLKCALLGGLEPGEVRDLLRDVEMVDLLGGEVIFRQGDAADRLYVVVDGAVVPIAETEAPVRMGVLESGDFFGEIGLLSDQPRNATVEALVDTRLLAIDRQLVWSLLGRHPEVLRVLLRTLRERLVDRLIRTSPLLAAFAAAKRSMVSKQFRMLEVRPDTLLLEQGLPNQGLFVVLAGSLEVVQRSADGEKAIAMLGHGDLFGEMSLLYGTPASARVMARSKCWLLFLSHARFVQIAGANPGLIEFIQAVAETRDRANRERSDSGRRASAAVEDFGVKRTA